MEFANSVVHTIRSMRADYQLTKTKTDRKSACTSSNLDTEHTCWDFTYIDFISTNC